MTTGKVALLSLVVLLTLVGAMELRPSNEERVSMLMKDGKTLRALQKLRAMTAGGDHAPSTLIELYNVESDLGQITPAVRHLEDYTAVRSDDLAARAKLTDLYATTQNLEKLIGSLERLVALRPERQTVQRLLDLYRMHGRFDAEERLLSTVPGPCLDTFDYERLAHMLSVKGEADRAIAVLRGADRGAGPGSAQSRRLLFRLLVERRRPATAVDYALRWNREWQNVDALEPLVVQLARAGHGDEAVRLVRQASRILPGVQLTLAMRMPYHGVAATGRQLVADWASGIEHASTADISAFVAASNIIDDPGLALAALVNEMSRVPASPALEPLMAEIGHQIGGRTLAGVVLSMRGGDLFRHPMLAARVALLAGNRMLAEQLLLGVSVNDLDSDRRRQWVAMLTETVGTRRALSILMQIKAEQNLSGEVYKELSGALIFVNYDAGNRRTAPTIH